MPNQESIKKLDDTSNKWVTLIQSAEEELEAARIRINELEAAKRIFESKRDAGEPFPASTQNDHQPTNA